MKIIQRIGLFTFLGGFAAFLCLLTVGQYTLTDNILKTNLKAEHYAVLQPSLKNMVGKTYTDQFSFVADFNAPINALNDGYRAKQEWNKVIYDKYAFAVTKASSGGFAWSWWFLVSFGLAVVGALTYILPTTRWLPGIKNNGIFREAATSRGWVGISVGVFLVLFYIVLYFGPEYITNWVLLVDPISRALSGNAATQWFLYGFLYCLCVVIMGIRMLIKYRHSPYQMLRTGSVMFFQLAIAFILPELLLRFNLPYFDFKNMWPLDYDFFFDYNLNALLASGKIGIFMLGWGIALFVVGVPVMTYFFGKRWYCSWVCGCGGLAETLGDPFRQLSNKTLKVWKIERYLIHFVLAFAVIMTSLVLYTYFTGRSSVLFLDSYSVRSWYGFYVGAIFSGVVGTGFYPVMGNRVWCRFGCPLAAYLGLVQKYQSRFRITTNGGQCISCGNCSTYCEMGIDVRAYAQRGQDIVRSSCVGCGVCSSVCPRGVLNLENADPKSRVLLAPNYPLGHFITKP